MMPGLTIGAFIQAAKTAVMTRGFRQQQLRSILIAQNPGLPQNAMEPRGLNKGPSDQK